MTEIQNPKPVYDPEEDFFIHTGEVKIADELNFYLHFGHWVLEFEIYLLFGACDLRFLDPPTPFVMPVH